MSDLEEAFAFQLSAIGLDGFVREYRAIPERRFRFDFAFVPERVLIEIQGGTWNRGAHGRASGLAQVQADGKRRHGQCGRMDRKANYEYRPAWAEGRWNERTTYF